MQRIAWIAGCPDVHRKCGLLDLNTCLLGQDLLQRLASLRLVLTYEPHSRLHTHSHKHTVSGGPLDKLLGI